MQRRDFLYIGGAGALTGCTALAGVIETAHAQTGGAPLTAGAVEPVGIGNPAIVPHVAALPPGERFSQSADMALTSDVLPRLNAALKKYGHLALGIGNIRGKPERPPGTDPYNETCYPVSGTVIVPSLGTLIGRNTCIATLQNFPAEKPTPVVYFYPQEDAHTTNTQLSEGLRINGGAAKNPHVIGMSWNNAVRSIHRDHSVQDCYVSFLFDSVQYGHWEYLHSVGGMIGFLLQTFANEGGMLDITQWGRFYAWAGGGSNDSAPTVTNGIGLVMLCGGLRSNYQPDTIQGFFARTQAQAVAIVRDPRHRADFNAVNATGMALKINTGSSEYCWAGQGGEDEMITHAGYGYRQPVPLAVFPQNGSDLNRAVVPFQTRSALFYLDYTAGLELQEFSINDNFAKIIAQLEDTAFLRLGEVNHGGTQVYGARAWGPNAYVDMLKGVSLGYQRVIWENVRLRPRYFVWPGYNHAATSFLTSQQQGLVIGSFGPPTYAADWAVPLPGSNIPSGAQFSPVNSASYARPAIPDRYRGFFAAASAKVIVGSAEDAGGTTARGYGENWAGLPPWGSAHATVGSIVFKAGCDPVADFVYSPYGAGGDTPTTFTDMSGVGVEGGYEWQIMMVCLKLAAPPGMGSVRVAPHVRKGARPGPGDWITGCNPHRHGNVTALTIGPADRWNRIDNPLTVAGNGNVTGWSNINCQFEFTGFTGLQVDSMNPGVIGKPPLKGGTASTWLLGDNPGSFPFENGTGKSALQYRYQSRHPDAAIRWRAALPEGITLWAGHWMCAQVIWQDNQDARLAVSLTHTPAADVTVLYKCFSYVRARNQQLQAFNRALHEATWF